MQAGLTLLEKYAIALPISIEIHYIKVKRKNQSDFSSNRRTWFGDNVAI